MKRIKIILACTLFLAMAVFQNEQYFYYLMKFYQPLSFAQLYLSAYTQEHEDGTESDMIRDINNASADHNVKVMVYTLKSTNNNEMVLNIYAGKSFQKILEEKYYVRSGKYSSLFSGKIHVCYHSFDEIAKDENMSEINTFYLYGTQKNMYRFKEALYEYAGAYPQKGTSNHSMAITVFVWLILIFLLIFSSMMDVLMTKKQYSLKIILGEDAINLWIKEIAIDIGTVVLFYIFFCCIMRFYYKVNFYSGLIAVLILLMCLGKVLTYLPMLRVNITSVIKNGEHTSLILKIGYVLRICFGIMSGIALGLCFVVLLNGWKLYSQRDFFEEHKDYEYVHLDPVMSNQEWSKEWNDNGVNMSLKPLQDLYREKEKDFSATMMCSNTDFFIDEIDKKHRVITGNAPMIKEIEKKLQIKIDTSCSCVILYPEDVDYKKIQFELDQGIKRTYGQSTNISVIHQSYRKKSWFTSINQNKNYGSEYLLNPVIVLFLQMPYKDVFDADQSSIYLYDMMYKTDKKDLKTYVKTLSKRYGYEIDIRTDNVLQQYLYYWDFVKKEVASNLFFVVFITLLSVLSLRLLIQCDKEINGKERTLKRIFGHSYYGRNKEIILPSLVVWGIEVIISIAILFSNNINGNLPIFFGIMCGVIIDIIQSILLYANVEKINMLQIINRGGGL